ncbi:hypothetical protein CH305_18555 [Rhodococcus sp. 15-649-2-2]|uniref:hypothetical protein n=1 Tax=Rhodococcus sp. 15-649-2-2 TaxID=2023140 RepID=UPI000B9B68D3|nr:hypothetical protein [Rhodococcus sp. 15-649-2-2]OZE77238.1 hypothetical protein CH305_18555 [Rhodococcus sp. 15-649-2-2]
MAFNFTLPAKLNVRLADQWDIRNSGRGLIEIEAGNMDVDVLAYKGDPGDPGRDGVAVQIHRAEIPADIPLLGDLDDTWIGHGWRVDGSRDVKLLVEETPGGALKFETLTNYLGDKGDTGPRPTFTAGTVTAGTTPTDLNLTVREISEGAYAIDAVLPRGNPGAASTVPGPTASFFGASDGDGLTAASVGDVLYKRSSGTIGAKPLNVSPGVYKKAGSDADWLAVNTGNGWTGAYQTITTMVIPAQPYAYEPDVTGLCEFFVTTGVRMDLEAHLGAVSGPLLARGPGASLSSWNNEWMPRLLVPGSDETIAAPTSSSTIVPANTAATIYLIAVRVDSLTAVRFESRKTRAYLRVRPVPVAV